MQVIIDLNNRTSAESINVDLQWIIQVTEEKQGFFPKLFRRYNRIERKLKLSVSNIVILDDKDNKTDEIECNKNKLFAILYNDKVTQQLDFPVDVELNSMELPFQLLFNQNEIKDCNKQQDGNPRTYYIKFDVNVHNEEGSVISTHNEKIDIVFQPLNIETQLNTDIEEEIQYSSSLKNEQIGVLAAWVEENFSYTPNQLVSISLKLFRGTTELPGLITFDNGTSEINNLEVVHGRDNVKRLPMFVDFTTIYNPVEEEEDYTIEVAVVRSQKYSPDVKKTTLLPQIHFRLIKDLQGTELKVYIEKKNGTFDITKNKTATFIETYNFVPRSRLMSQVRLIFSNIATDDSNPRSGICIRNLTISESLLNDVKLLGENNAIINNFIMVGGTNLDKMKSTHGMFIANGADKKDIITVSFNPIRIVDIINSNDYNFAIQSVISFDYWEDKDGTGIYDENDKKVCKIPLTWNLHLEPNPEWLCVDYGSSAIVCRYDKEILDLKKQKYSIFTKADDGKFREDTIEQNTKFLSSDIVLHDVRETNTSTLCSEQIDETETPYLNLSVCLSPTSSLIVNDIRKLLPCLKILVGNTYLPTKPEFMDFLYRRRDSNGEITKVAAKDAMKNEEDSCLMRISSIFNESYSSLFKYFIKPVSKNRNINKLVITYPNTYTPAHLRVLEGIVKRTFPKVRDGYLRFVSESDSVAAYYIQNWCKFNTDGNIKKSETVLVYDMGAGTLDITLFKKQLNKEGKIEVSILGKIGTGKSGNYLDYLISDIIRNKVKNAIKLTGTVSTVSVLNNATLQERLAVKMQVKNSIKPMLCEDVTLKCNEQKFDSSVILNDEDFNEFLDQITYGIILQLMNYVGDPKLKVNTIIMSGRSCRLQAIQDALNSSIVELGWSGAKIVKFDSSNDEEKTVVVEGAMIRAALFTSDESPVIIRSRRLYASYGLIYQQLGGTYKYVELLHSSDLPFITDVNDVDDYTGPNVVAEGVAAAGTIKLVQTYLSKEDTEKAYNNGNLEFISVMEEYDASSFGGKSTLNVKLHLDYKNNISLYVDGLISVGSFPKGVDLTSEITKRSIWPVTI